MIINRNPFLLLPLSLLVTLLITLGGCQGGKPASDQRLLAAEQLLSQYPDSALRLLDTIDAGSLAGEANRAYHALLLTQARYRCYVPATSDSLINLALDYYECHNGDREKLTRAYIYKGAVMTELCRPEAAMTYYKRAQETVAPDDYFNRGYICLRLGQIYNDSYVADSIDIVDYKAALSYFRMVPDSFYITSALSAIGASYAGKNQTDSADKYLRQAIDLSVKMHYAGLEFVSLKCIAALKMFSHDAHDVEEARGIALSLLNKQCGDDDRNYLLMVETYALAKLNKADSAVCYFGQVDEQRLSIAHRVLYNKCRAELALRHGDIDQYEYYFKLEDDCADSLLSSGLQQRLRDVETMYDNEALKYQSLKYRTNWMLSLFSAALAILALVAAVMYMRRKRARLRQQLREQEDTIERMRNDTARLTSQLNSNQAMSEDLKQTIHHQIDVFARLIEVHTTSPTHSRKRFNEAFKQSYDMNQPDKSFWTGIRAYADSQYNEVITRLMAAYPSLIESDLNYLALYSCDLPATVIMACMGYDEIHSLYNKKRRVASRLGCPNHLDDFLNAFISGQDK